MDQNSVIRGRSPPQRPDTDLKLGGSTAKTLISGLGAGVGVRPCAGVGAAQRAQITQSPPTPSTRGVRGAASAEPLRQGVEAALWGSLGARASWQPSASHLVREAAAGPPECPSQRIRAPAPWPPSNCVGQRPVCCGQRVGTVTSAHGAMRRPIGRRAHRQAVLRSGCRKGAPPDRCTRHFLRAARERIVATAGMRAATSGSLAFVEVSLPVRSAAKPRKASPSGGTQNLVFLRCHVTFYILPKFPRPSTRGVSGAARAVPQRQGVEAALWGLAGSGGFLAAQRLTLGSGGRQLPP